MKSQKSSIRQNKQNSIFSKLFFHISPFAVFHIKENSMFPFLQSGENILVSKIAYLFHKPKIDDVIIVKKPKNGEENYLVKRISKMKDTKLYVLGDNRRESIDSRKFGWVYRKNVVGKMVGKV